MVYTPLSPWHQGSQLLKWWKFKSGVPPSKTPRGRWVWLWPQDVWRETFQSSASFAQFWHVFFASSNGFPGRSEKRCLKNPQGWGLNSLSAYCSTSHAPQGIKSLLQPPMMVSCQGATKQIDGTSSSTQNESDASSATSWGLSGGRQVERAKDLFMRWRPLFRSFPWCFRKGAM